MARMAAIALALVAPCAALAQSQSVGNTNDSTSAVIIEGAAAPSDTQTVRTNPDASAPPVMTAPRSCYVGQGSVSIGSYLFGGVSGSKTMLDEGCEARADSDHLAALAVTRHNLGYRDRAAQLLTAAELRMGMTRDAFVALWGEPQAELWEPIWNP